MSTFSTIMFFVFFVLTVFGVGTVLGYEAAIKKHEQKVCCRAKDK